MAQTILIDGVECRMNETKKGVIYSKNFRSLKAEAESAGTVEARVDTAKHAFYLGSNAYYIGPSLQSKSAQEIAELASDISVSDSSIDKVKWVPCLWLSNVGEKVTLKFK